MSAETETYEERLTRLFSGWTDGEVEYLMTLMRDHTTAGTRNDMWDDVWRAYAMRTYSDNVVCHRCGSENHGTVVHHE